MRITLKPETYRENPVFISVPMGQKDEQELMSAAKAVKTVQGVVSILNAITKRLK